MDNELKELLLKVADYSELQKRKAVREGNLVLGVMFITCVLVIVIQILVTGNLSLVAGEIAILAIGGIMYIILEARNGAWENGTIFSVEKKNFIAKIGRRKYDKSANKKSSRN